MSEMPDSVHAALETLVRTAVKAERDRCAKIAEQYECGLMSYNGAEARHFYESGVIDAAIGIATAIRTNGVAA